MSKLVGKGNYAYEQGFSNEKSEEDARVAFTIFFVSLYGDIRTYLTQQTPGHPPVIDKEKFMRSRAANGDMPGSGMFLLLSNFLRGKMFDTFVAARLNEVQLRRPVTCNLIGRTTGGGGPRYRMMYPTINHGGTNNNGNTKQRTTTYVRL